MLPSSIAMAELLGNHTEIKIEEEVNSSTNKEERSDQSPWFRRECENKLGKENESGSRYELAMNGQTLEES